MELIRFKGEIKEKEKRPLLNNFIFGGNCGAAVDGRCASINLKSSVCVCGRQSHNGPLHSWSQPNRLFGHQVSHFMQLRLFLVPPRSRWRSEEEAVEIINHLLKPTVFLHCRYLVERKGMAPQKAIEGVCVVLAIIGSAGISFGFYFSLLVFSAFNDARGHPMERQNYIDGILAINQPKRSGSALSCGCVDLLANEMSLFG